MKKIKLSPFVYKVKGDRNWLLCDLLEGRMFQITPEGDVETLKRMLLEANLAFETDGVIPFKYSTYVNSYKKNISIKELQIRITGECELDCQDCGTNVCSCFKGKDVMTLDLAKIIFKQFEYIPVEHVVLTGGNPLTELETVKKIREGISAGEYSILFKGPILSGQQEILNELGIGVIDPVDRIDPLQINEEKMIVDAFYFFYFQHFNPCWGNKIAIDLDGNVKPCLWSEIVLGNIWKANIKDRIIAGDFDRYWELTKDKMETCRSCEYRCMCGDCRVKAARESNSLSAKLPACSYDPKTGKWEK